MGNCFSCSGEIMAGPYHHFEVLSPCTAIVNILHETQIFKDAELVEVSKARLNYLLKCEREVQTLQTDLDCERQSKLSIIDWAEGIRRHNTSLLSKQKKISRVEARRTKFLVNRRLGSIGEN